MSKIILVSLPAYGHVNPTLPSVQELIKRGEQVIYYTSAELRPDIERSGAEFRAYPTNELTTLSMPELHRSGNLANLFLLLLQTTEALTPYVIEELSCERPDLVVVDMMALWGWIAAKSLNLKMAASIPTFALNFNALQLTPAERFTFDVQMRARKAALLASRHRLIEHHGIAPPASGQVRGGINLVYTARQFQPNTPGIDHTYRFVGPIIDTYIRPEEAGFGNLPDGDRAVVYISLGTIHHLKIEFYRTCLEAFADHPAQIVLSVGKQIDISALGDIPANFIVRPSVPRLKILERANVFFTHGGLNSVHEGLYYGVPLIVIPQHIEHLFNGRVVQKHRAGLVLNHHVLRQRLAAADLRQALDEVLSQPRYRESAQKVQSILRATGGYRQAADEIQAYIARTESRGDPL